MAHNSITAVEILKFLQAVDKSFPTPLSKKQNLSAYAEKLYGSATICAQVENGKILSMVAGYTENLVGGIAYIAVVATISEAAGRGLAKKCVKQFIEICREKNIPAVHLYTDNPGAEIMYKKIGFEDYFPENEPRPNNLHLIYKIQKEQ